MNLRRALQNAAFRPGLLGLLGNPFYLARRELWKVMKGFRQHVHGRVLDVGCGTQPYRSLFEVESYRGLEIDTPQARARKAADDYYDGGRFPYPDASFDSVLCSQVLEHSFAPEMLLGEIARVLKPGGKLVLTVPFVWDEHEQPWDYARYSSFGLRALVERSGLTVSEHRKLNDGAAVLFQLANAYLYKVLGTPSRAFNLLLCVVLMFPISLVGLLLGAALPRNPDLYLDHAVLAAKP
jgi:SAM-dependent methyltransferase